MKRSLRQWQFEKDGVRTTVELPHDAMLTERRRARDERRELLTVKANVDLSQGKDKKQG